MGLFLTDFFSIAPSLVSFKCFESNVASEAAFDLTLVILAKQNPPTLAILFTNGSHRKSARKLLNYGVQERVGIIVLSKPFIPVESKGGGGVVLQTACTRVG